MAHFYGELEGSRGPTTRCGTKNSGIDAHLRGWSFGARALVEHEEGVDVVYLHLTSGSNRESADVCIGRFVLADLFQYRAALKRSDAENVIDLWDEIATERGQQ